MASIEEDEEAPQEPSKPLTAEEESLNEQIQEAWAKGRPAEPPAPAPAPEPEQKKPETMDEKLQRLAAERVQAQVRGKQAREMRARYLKQGGRPNAQEFAEWREASIQRKKV